MLNFSKINVFIIYFLLIITAAFSFLNFQNENAQLIEKKINLGLDLQGGSYLLLEINSIIEIECSSTSLTELASVASSNSAKEYLSADVSEKSLFLLNVMSFVNK